MFHRYEEVSYSQKAPKETSGSKTKPIAPLSTGKGDVEPKNICDGGHMPRPNAGYSAKRAGDPAQAPKQERRARQQAKGKELRSNVALIAEISASQIARRRHAPVSIASKQTIWADAFSTTRLVLDHVRMLEIGGKNSWQLYLDGFFHLSTSSPPWSRNNKRRIQRHPSN